MALFKAVTPKPAVTSQSQSRGRPEIQPIPWDGRSTIGHVQLGPNVRTIIDRAPIGMIAKGQLTAGDLQTINTREGPAEIQNRIQEADRALAATTPVLGQYAPTFGWPDDWGWYWEYLDAYLFIPEVSFATKLKTRMTWKMGWDVETADAQEKRLLGQIDGASQSIRKKLVKEWKRRGITRALIDLQKNGLIWGNGYAESVDDSKAEFAESTPADFALGAGFSTLTYAPRPLKSYTPPTKFYGLKLADPRTVRIQIHPQQFGTPLEMGSATDFMRGLEGDWPEPDSIRPGLRIEKLIQRRWSGPLAPTAIMGTGNTEIDFHPEQMLALQYNKITGGIYGYSMFREVLFTLKGWLVMLQYLPQIFQKRADTLLQIKYGGNVYNEGGLQVSKTPDQASIDLAFSRIKDRAPGEDIATDWLTTIEQIMKSEGPISGLQDFLVTFKERVLMGLGIPLTVATMAGGQEIKWGSLNFDVLYDEIGEYQDVNETFINDYVFPRLLLNLGHKMGDGPELEFHYKDVHPEDWQASVEPMRNLYKDQIVSQEYVLDRLNIPVEAAKGSMFKPPEKPVAGDRPAPKTGERWRLKQTQKGVIAERLGND